MTGDRVALEPLSKMSTEGAEMSRKRISILSGLASAVLALSLWTGAARAACEPKIGHPPLIRKGSLIAAINPTVAPIQYVNEDGDIIGLDPDLGNAIAERLCLKMVFESVQFATMIPGLQDGRFDLINSFMFYTPERASQVIMIPYGASTLAMVVGKDNKDDVKGLDYFSGKKFAVELGTVDASDAKQASDALVAAGKPGIDVQAFKTYAEVLQTLSAGQVDGAFIGTEQAFYYQKTGQTFFRIAVSGFDPHAEALAFKDQALAETVAGVMNEMKADGSFDKLFASYHHCTLPGPYKIVTGPLPAPQCTNTP
jgi:polar amino acid transport system substrate-binding protein